MRNVSGFPSAIGPYQVLARLGEGGMGEVSRVRDSKLNRDVAIKVLLEAFALDADGQRFLVSLSAAAERPSVSVMLNWAPPAR